MATPHLDLIHVQAQTGVKQQLVKALLEGPALVQPGTAITTVQVAGVLIAEVIPGVALVTFATSNEYQL